MKAIDKALRVCDGGLHFLIYKDEDGSIITEKFSDLSSLRNRQNTLKKHGITASKEWANVGWVSNKADFNRTYNQIISKVKAMKNEI